MSFPLVHFRSRLFLYDKSGNLILDLRSNYIGSTSQSTLAHDCEIDMTYNFQSQSTPATTQITLHNLNDTDTNKFKKGDTISIWAGWCTDDWTQDNLRQIFTSTINTLSPIQNDSGDWQMQITCQDGNKFSGEVALSKIYKAQSESIRSKASGTDSLTRQGRHQVKLIERKYGIRGNNLEKIKKQLMPKKKLIDARLSRKEKKQEAALMKEYKTIHKGHHGRRGSNEGSYNKSIVNERKAARKAIIDSTRRQRNKIKKQFEGYEASLKGRKLRITQNKKRAARRIRTRIASRRQKIRRKNNQRKTKSKKKTSSGLHFKKNTRGLTIIKRLAKIGHIKISHINLVKNHRFTSGYTATKTPWEEIQTVAQDYCNSNIWWPHGELYIGNFAQHKEIDFTLTPDTGLLQTPSPEDDDDGEDDNDISTQTMNKKQIKSQERQNSIANPTVYQINAIFLPFVTTGSTFKVVDPSVSLDTNYNGDDAIPAGSLFSNEVVVQSGSLSFGGNDAPSSQLDVITKSALMQKQEQSDNAKELKAKEAANKAKRKDKRKRLRIKTKRAKRHTERMHNKRK